MLSVRGGAELGFRGGMELEEGEACSGPEDDGFVDPDTALSYIDDKLQDVLGHFQKDFFEGGVSAENLGTKFGGYGSFLPAYQRSPQHRTPSRGQNQVVSRSPCYSSYEAPQVPTAASVSRNNNPPTSLSVDNLGNTPTTNISVSKPVPQNSFNRLGNGTDQKTLKVRIKVGPNNSSARNNTAIYSGLGLDISPSSSPEDDSPDWSSPKFLHAPIASPTTILKVMTCFSVPGGYLLSPLPDSALHLPKKGIAFLKNCKTSVYQEGIRESCDLVTDIMLPEKDVNGFTESKTKPTQKSRRTVEAQSSNSKDDRGTVLKRGIDNGTPGGQKPVFEALSIPLLSGSGNTDLKAQRRTVGDSVKDIGSKLDLPKESNMILQDAIFSPDLEQGYQSGSIESIKNNSTSYSRGKHNPKPIPGERPLQSGNKVDRNDTSSGTRREGKLKADKSYDSGSAYRSRKTSPAASAKSPNLISSRKATLCEEDGEKVLQRKDHFSEGKRKVKASLSNVSPAVDLKKENMMTVSSATLKEKKKSSYARDDDSGKRSKGSKSRKEAGKGRSKDSHRLVHDKNAEPVHCRSNSKTTYTDMSKDSKLQHELEPVFPEMSSITSGVKKFDNRPIKEDLVDAPLNAPLMPTTLNSDAAVSSVAPVVIKENWVACDLCHEWRLLPYGSDAENLPNRKWECSMQTWLPGLNKCHIEEAVTTKALNALYQTVPESVTNLNGRHDNAAAPINSTNISNFNQRLGHNMQTLPAAGKKKLGLKDGPNLKTPAKEKSVSNVNESPSEAKMSNKVTLGRTSKSTDYATEKHNYKQNEKCKVTGRYSDGGNTIGNDRRLSKSKSKREGDEGFRSSKKLKKEGSNYSIEDSQSNLAADRDAHTIDYGIQSKTIGKSSHRSADYSSSKDIKCEPKEHLPASAKRKKDEIPTSTKEDVKEHFSSANAEKIGLLDISAKKRKLKEWQASQENRAISHHNLDGRVLQEASSESNVSKQKKPKLSNSAGKEPGTIDGRMDRGHLTTILNNEHPPGGIDGARGVAVKVELGKGQGSTNIHRGSDSTGYLKRDVTYAPPLAAATSSSSKVSGSRRSKAIEARGSPVESVSSSPFRVSNTEKLSTKRKSAGKGDVINAVFLSTGSPKRCSDAEIEGASDRSGTRKETLAAFECRSLDNHIAAESGFLDSHKQTHDFHDSDANQLCGGKAGDLMHMRSRGHGLSSPLLDDENLVSGTGDTQRSRYLREPSVEDNNHGQYELGDHPRRNGPGQWKSGKSSSLSSKEQSRRSKTDGDKVKLKVSDFSSNQKELLPAKIGSSHQPDPDISHHGRPVHHDLLRTNDYTAQEKDVRDQKFDVIKPSSAGRKDGHQNYGGQETVETDGPSMLRNQHKDLDSKFAGATCSKSDMKENIQQLPPQHDDNSSHIKSDRNGWPGKGKSQMLLHSEVKQEVQVGSEEILKHASGSRSEGCPTDAIIGDASRLAKQSRKLDSQNGLPNFQDASLPMRKNNHPTAIAVMKETKEARDLKHTANRLKNEGLQLESTGLYFQAALKFLHVASLKEPTNRENANYGEAVSSMQMYSDTASLCEFCAREYEKCKEVAAASLAYKCMEVAYMKVIYYKNRSVSKDRHELQVALQMIPPGDSPSSSASDVDNLNNHCSLDKAASLKGTASPHIAGSHIIAAPNRPNVIRVLDYMNIMTCAFEASRKSQSSMTSAINQGKYGVDGLSSVKTVLDFNFHDIEGFLRLVRLSMDSIGH